VGLSSDWGTILIGRRYSPALLAELGTDPRGYKESFSSLLSLAANQLPEGNDLTGSNNGAGIFTSNMVSYTASSVRSASMPATARARATTARATGAPTRSA
jgi:predicted porin